ncbi:MAG: aldo/keto reductase [Muribaculum sp.]|nr:aldo/keto reductase [Muribaculum sp.]
MKIITFPNGEEVCVLGQGTWNIGRNPLTRKAETDALLAGLDIGMRMIDTAEMYANEEFIGRALSGRRHEAFLVSKVHPDNADFEGTIKACEKSLKKLGTDYLDLYLLHWCSRHHISQTVEAMCRLQREGKIRLWGVSNLDVDDMEIIEELPNGCGCDANQVLYNLSERGVEYDLIPYAQENEIPVIAYSPIGEGLLVRHPILRTIAEKHNATRAQIALAWTITILR